MTTEWRDMLGRKKCYHELIARDTAYKSNKWFCRYCFTEIIDFSKYKDMHHFPKINKRRKDL